MEVQEVEVVAACGAQNSQYISEAPIVSQLAKSCIMKIRTGCITASTHTHNGADVGVTVRAKDNIVYWLPHTNLGRFLAPPACSP